MKMRMTDKTNTVIITSKKRDTGTVKNCIADTLGEVCAVYQKDNVFVCVSTTDIRGYISQFKDALGFCGDIDVEIKYELGR